jgi:hypothetical protein
MQPPFLDLSFYVGKSSVSEAPNSLLFSLAPELPSEVHKIGGCIVIRTEGEAFCGSMRSDTARLRRLGEAVYVAFTAAAERIDCAYGAILVEYTLEEPTELRRDPRSLAFQNFYLGRHWLSATLVSNVISMAPPGAFIEERAQGIDVSTSKEFSPSGSDVDRGLAQAFSIRVAKEIGLAIV